MLMNCQYDTQNSRKVKKITSAFSIKSFKTVDNSILEVILMPQVFVCRKQQITDAVHPVLHPNTFMGSQIKSNQSMHIAHYYFFLQIYQSQI